MHLFDDFDEALVEIEAVPAFLPFVGGEAARIERCGMAAKRCLGVDEDTALDPWTAAQAIDVPVLGKDFLERFDGSLRGEVLDRGSRRWSAGTLLADGKALILLNSLHNLRRQKVTLAEELAHLVMGHPPSEIDLDTGFRTYDSGVESEAYGVGGSMVLPYADLFNIVRQGSPDFSIADRFKVSSAFVSYRINRTGLRKVYTKQQQRA